MLVGKFLLATVTETLPEDRSCTSLMTGLRPGLSPHHTARSRAGPCLSPLHTQVLPKAFSVYKLATKVSQTKITMNLSRKRVVRRKAVVICMSALIVVV